MVWPVSDLRDVVAGRRLAVPSAVAMSKVTPPAGAGAERLTVNVKVVVPALPSFSETSLIVRLGARIVVDDRAQALAVGHGGAGDVGDVDEEGLVGLGRGVAVDRDVEGVGRAARRGSSGRSATWRCSRSGCVAVLSAVAMSNVTPPAPGRGRQADREGEASSCPALPSFSETSLMRQVGERGAGGQREVVDREAVIVARVVECRTSAARPRRLG